MAYFWLWNLPHRMLLPLTYNQVMGKEDWSFRFSVTWILQLSQKRDTRRIHESMKAAFSIFIHCSSLGHRCHPIASCFWEVGNFAVRDHASWEDEFIMLHSVLVLPLDKFAPIRSMGKGTLKSSASQKKSDWAAGTIVLHHSMYRISRFFRLLDCTWGIRLGSSSFPMSCPRFNGLGLRRALRTRALWWAEQFVIGAWVGQRVRLRGSMIQAYSEHVAGCNIIWHTTPHVYSCFTLRTNVIYTHLPFETGLLSYTMLYLILKVWVSLQKDKAGMGRGSFRPHGMDGINPFCLQKRVNVQGGWMYALLGWGIPFLSSTALQ